MYIFLKNKKPIGWAKTDKEAKQHAYVLKGVKGVKVAVAKKLKCEGIIVYIIEDMQDIDVYWEF